MPFPKTKTKQNSKVQKAALHGLQITKQKGFPLFMCEFFEGMEVLQTQGIESKEFIWGIYFNNKYCGHIYFGDKYTAVQAARICQNIMPPTWEDIMDYVAANLHKVWYHKMAPEQYAWIYEKVLQKID